jgi:hypothetical protein
MGVSAIFQISFGKYSDFLPKMHFLGLLLTFNQNNIWLASAKHE